MQYGVICGTAMAEIDIELDSNLIEGVKRLAVSHYGDCGDVSIGRVAEAALNMRLLWEDLVKGGENEIEEPIVDWEFPSKQPAEELTAEITDWLFRGR